MAIKTSTTVVPAGGSNTRYFRYRQNVNLGPNQSLHYAQGKGYYAGPAIYPKTPPPPPGIDPNYWRAMYLRGQGMNRLARSGVFTGGVDPTKPVKTVVKKPVDPWGTMGALTNAQIQARAEAIARGELLPQQQEIRRQQGIAARTAREQEEQIQGFAKAAAGIEGGLAPQVSQAYSTATTDIGGLGEGMSAGIQADMQAQQAHDQALAAQQGVSTTDTTSAQGMRDVNQMLTGVIPGTSLAERGAAATAEAAGVPQIQLNAGRQDLESAMAKAKQTNDDYAQQLIQLAATFPGLKAQALQTLNQYELDKANYRNTVVQNNRQYALQLAAYKATAKTAGLTPYQAASLKQRQDALNREYKYKYAALRFKKQQDINKAKQSGKIIDVQASRLRGHIVYKDGSEDPSIKVAPSTGLTPAQKNQKTALANRNRALMGAGKTAYSTALKAIGTPILAKPHAGFRHPQGRYIARKGAINVFHDGTTNDPKKAAKSGGVTSYSDALNEVLGAMNVDQLMAQFNLSRAQLVKLAKAQMKRAGWRLPGSIPVPPGASVT